MQNRVGACTNSREEGFKEESIEQLRQGTTLPDASMHPEGSTQT